MSATVWTYTAFAVVCLLLLTLPFVPAFREWLRPSDAEPLPISASYTSDIDHFAKRLHADATAKLGQGPSTGYEDFEFVNPAWAPADWGQPRKRLISTQPLDTTQAIRSTSPLYVEGSVNAGANSKFSALYATGSIALGEHSEIQDWAHADGLLRLTASGVALRRVSSSTAIELGDECWFERLQAPVMRFGSSNSHLPGPIDYPQMTASYAGLPQAVQQTPTLFLIRGDCVLPAASRYVGSLVVTGFLTIGEGTTVVGDIKARDGISVGHLASVEGAVTCEKRVYMFNKARALGPVVAEGDILLGAHTLVGLPDAPTTLSAVNIIIESGAVVHGMIWAREIGMVKSL